MLDLIAAIKGNSAYFKQLQCKGILFTQYDCPQQVGKTGLFSNCNYISYVISGRRILSKPGQCLEMTEGKALFVKKGGWVAEKIASEGWCVMIFFIPDEYLKKFIIEYRPNLPLKDLPPAPTEQMVELNVNDTTRFFFQSMLPYFTLNPPAPENLLELKFKELVFDLLVNPANKHLLSYLNTISGSSKPSIEEVMELNFMHHLSMDDYAKLCNRSLASFKREFGELYKESPGRWLLQKRIGLAQLLLHTTQKPVNDIAYETGFENTTHFSRVFKTKLNLSPLQYRKTELAE